MNGLSIKQIQEAAADYATEAGLGASSDPSCRVRHYHSLYRTRGDNTDFSIPVQVWINVPVRFLHPERKEDS